MKYILLIICLFIPVGGLIYCVYNMLITDNPLRRLKKYRVEYLIQYGWGIGGDDFFCSAYSKREAHQKFIDANLRGVYGSENFNSIKDDIHEI